MATAGVLLLIYRGGVVSIWGYYYKGGWRIKPYLRPADRLAESTAVPPAIFSAKTRGVDGLNRTFGRPIGRPKVRRADKYAEPTGTPNPRYGLIR